LFYAGGVESDIHVLGLDHLDEEHAPELDHLGIESGIGGAVGTDVVSGGRGGLLFLSDSVHYCPLGFGSNSNVCGPFTSSRHSSREQGDVCGRRARSVYRAATKSAV